MKKLIAILLSLATIMALAGCSASTNSATIYVATDTHYLSPKVNDGGAAFQDMLAGADGRTAEYCDEIMDAFCAEIIEAKPDVVILSGDLTFNGERDSHIDLANKLKSITDQGITVLTIPGNHDINSKKAAQYKGDQISPTDTVTPEEYKEIYHQLGIAQAESVDKYSLSYMYKVNDGLYILMLDTNAYGQNFLQDSTYQWLEEQLKQAQNEGARVISVTHQNLYAHNEQLSFGYQLYDADELLEVLKKYDVSCNLSGHIHIQHIIEDEVTEISTSSLLVSPSQYGIIEYNGNLRYSAKAVDVAKWAADNGINNDDLLHYDAYSREQFVASGRAKAQALVENIDATDAEKEAMVEAFAQLNASYFAGEKCNTSPLSEGIQVAQAQDGFISKYIQTMLDEAKKEHTHCKVKMK